MDRRSFLSATAVAAAAPLVGMPAIGAAEPAASSKPGPVSELAAAAVANRMPLDFDGKRFSGPGYNWLLKRGAEAQAFLVGEEHGIAENPELAAQLFAALVPHGYRHVAVEVSPPMADALDAALRNDGAAFELLLTTAESRVPFFGMREEAQWLLDARAAVPGRQPFLWGLDYDVAADRYLLEQLKRWPKPAAAQRALAQVAAASAASWARYMETKNPQFIYSFAGDPADIRALRDAWPGAAARTALILETLEQTLAINALWVAGKGYESNVMRSRFMRSNLLRYWTRMPPGDRLFMKLGASHLVRGVSMSDVFDIGTMVPELVAPRGGNSFHLLVLPGPGTQTANLDPTKFVYVPGQRDEYGEGMDIFDKSVVADKFTLYDTAPLRSLASGSGGVPLPLWRVIHGFDAVLVMTGSHPSTNL